MPIYALDGVAPRLASGVYVAPTATIIGDVELAEDASVWFGAVLRGDMYPIRIGARTNIQDNAVVHVTGGRTSTTVGADVTVGHSAIVHGCVVGDRCLIGMGSILLDGAVIGEESLVAAGALVPPGMKVPPRSMVVGKPAKVTRTLREDELAGIRAAAEIYVLNARAFATKLVRLDRP